MHKTYIDSPLRVTSNLISSVLKIFTNQISQFDHDMSIISPYCNIPGYPSSGLRGCQVTTVQCTPT